LGGGYVPDWDDDTVTGNTVRRTLYISNTSFPTSLSQFQVYPLGPYDDTARATVQAVIDAFMQGSTGNVSIVCIRTLVSATPDKLLDTYTGAAAAYSVRLLDKDYTGNAMRIREDSGDTETDIGFDSNGDLDTAAIATHCGSANGYVVTWYDQSGNSNNATQSTGTNQPQIYNGTSVLTQGTKPALLFDGSNDHFNTAANNPFSFTGGVSCIAAVYKNSTAYKDYETIMGAGISTQNSRSAMAMAYGNASAHSPKPTFGTDMWQPSGVQYDGTLSTNERRLLAWYISNWSTHRSTGLSNMTLDGSDISTTTYGSFDPVELKNNPITIGVFNISLTSSFFAGSMQEIIIYASDQNSNRTGIHTDVNSYFSIYT